MGPAWGGAPGGSSSCHLRLPQGVSVTLKFLPAAALGFRNLGQRVMCGTAGGRAPGQGSGGAQPPENRFCLLVVFFWFDFGLSEGTYWESRISVTWRVVLSLSERPPQACHWPCRRPLLPLPASAWGGGVRLEGSCVKWQVPAPRESWPRSPTIPQLTAVCPVVENVEKRRPERVA